ncbi:MAG: nitroreductase family deazaflavin-dependent oxidoreductase [Mycobacteriales bacterium]
MKPESAVRLDRSVGPLVYRLHRRLYRLTGGRIGARLQGRPMLLLTAIGAQSGQPRTVPLQYLQDGPEMVIVASNGGRPEAPAWLANLRAHPAAEVQVGGRRLAVTAHILDTAERAGRWPRLLEFYPGYGHYQTLTAREIPVVVLTPAGAAS